MRTLMFGEQRAVAGGLVDGAGPGNVVLGVGDVETITVTAERWGTMDEIGYQLDNFDWAGAANSIAVGVQTVVSDCANGIEVGAFFGAALGATEGGIGAIPGAMGGGALGCLVNVGAGVVNTATKK